MPAELYEVLARELFPTAAMVDLRGWGESTVLPDFGERLRRAGASGARLRLVTNGLAMSAEAWEGIFSSDGTVVLSVDAASQRLATALGRGSMSKMLWNLREGVSMARAKGQGRVYFHAVASALNLHELPQIVHMAWKEGVPKVMISPVRAQRESELSLEGVRAQVAEALGLCRKAGAETGVVVQIGAALDESAVIAKALPTTCANPWTDMVVSYNGDVIFCDHLIGHHEYATGNLLKQSIEDVWNGQTFQVLRRAHARAESTRCVKGFPKCSWCYAYRYGESEVAPGLGGEARQVFL